jgi:type IV pilus assembly protein PilC
MTVFAYRAMNPRGHVVRGELDAANLVDLELRLKRMELDFIHGAPTRRARLLKSGAVPRQELINFCFHLEQLTRAGVPILEGLTDLRDSTDHPRFREVVAGLVESIQGGRGVSEAMAEHPEAFDGVFCNLVRAGEGSGNLPQVLHDLAASLKREDELAAYARKIIIYPAVVSVVLLAAVAVSLLFVVPELAKLFRSTGQELPLQTRILVGASRWLQHYWWAVLAAGAAAVAGLRLAIATRPGARLWFDSLLLALPLLGEIRRKLILARFVGLFAMMYASGITIIAALRTAEDVMGNALLRQGMQRVGQLIGEGHNVSAAFQAVGLFPPLVTRMLRVGENTGALDAALANVSYFYDRDVRESVERLQALIEPLLTVLLGGIMLWIMMAVLGPVYDIITRLPV